MLHRNLGHSPNSGLAVRPGTAYPWPLLVTRGF
uniref:Uncharacterized protein n=1 Tax=Anguilla anguilla TaxID=7936 RepID=A0A0E9TNW7_ANGAN